MKFNFPTGASRKLWIGGGAIAAIGVIAVLATPRNTAPPAPLSQENASQVSAVQAAAPTIAGAEQKNAPPAPAKSTGQPAKKASPKKAGTTESPKVAEQTDKSMPEPATPAAPAAKPQDAQTQSPTSNGQTKPPEKKRGIFGEELKPSQWRKEGDLL